MAAAAPLAFLSACSDQDVSNAISNAIKAALWFMAKMILISLALLLAWAFAVMIGGALIALGVRRRRFDVLTALTVLGGVAVIAGAWPLVFSQSGLAGVIAPGSTGKASPGPFVAQAVGVLAVVVAVIVFMRRRDRKKRAAGPTNAPPLIGPPSPPAPPMPPALLAQAVATTVSAGSASPGRSAAAPRRARPRVTRGTAASPSARRAGAAVRAPSARRPASRSKGARRAP